MASPNDIYLIFLLVVTKKQV